MDRHFRFRLIPFLLFVLLTAGCSTPTPFSGVIPGPAPGTAQIVFYRDIGYYDPSNVLTVSLDDHSVAILPRGDVVYRDVPPATYRITFNPTRSYPDQFKTVTVASGDVVYVKLEALPEMACAGTRGSSVGGCDISGYTAVVIDAERARQEIRGLHLIEG